MRLPNGQMQRIALVKGRGPIHVNIPDSNGAALRRGIRVHLVEKDLVNDDDLGTCEAQFTAAHLRQAVRSGPATQQTKCSHFTLLWKTTATR